MSILDFAPFGTPPNHEQDTKDKAKALVQAPEFDITQYAKKLAVVVGVIAPASITALKLAKVGPITPGIVVGALAVTAVALLSVSLVMAVDLAARAYLTRGAQGADPSPKPDSASSAGGPLQLTAVTPGTLLWLEGEDDPRAVLALAGDGHSASAYLVAPALELERATATALGQVSAYAGSPEWRDANQVKAYHLPLE